MTSARRRVLHDLLTKRLSWVLLGVGAFGVAVCLGVGYTTFNGFSEELKKPADAIDLYFSGLKHRDVDKLRSSLCKENKKDAQGQIDKFHQDFQRDNLRLLDIRWSMGRRSGTATTYRAMVEVTYRIESGGIILSQKEQMMIILVKERNWQVCSVAR